MQVCPVCTGNSVATLFDKIQSVYSSSGNSIVSCRSCTHAFTGETPTSAELAAIYGKTYAYDAHALIENEKRWRATQFANLLMPIEASPAVLEIGCMHGHLLSKLKAKGAKVVGVEIDGNAVASCREKQLTVIQQSIEDYFKGPAETFDLIVMSHVFEHIVDLPATLVQLRKRLKPKGQLVLILPNARSLTANLFGRYWGYWQVPVHLNHFNGKSLTILLNKYGFKAQRLTYRGADSLFFLATLANLAGQKSKETKLSLVQSLIIRTASLILWPWFFIGNEDLVVFAEAT